MPRGLRPSAAPLARGLWAPGRFRSGPWLALGSGSLRPWPSWAHSSSAWGTFAELREVVRIPLGISGIRGPSEGRRQPHYSAVWESSQTEGAEPWVLAGPFRFTSSGQNTRITRGEGLWFSAGSQVISRNLFVKSNGGSSIGSGQWSWEWVQYRHVWRRDRANLRYASFGASRHQRS